MLQRKKLVDLLGILQGVNEKSHVNEDVINQQTMHSVDGLNME